MLPVPATWSPVKDASLAELVPVGAGAERAAVEGAFLRTLAGRGVQVVEVLRVQNKEKWSVFAVFRQSVLAREGGDTASAVERVGLHICIYYIYK